MKSINIYIITLYSLTLLNTQCDDDIVNGFSSNCDTTVIINNSTFESSTSDFYNSINAEIIDNCLFINVTSSGCNGESWEMSLIDSGNIAESSPPQRSLKFALTNNEACLAVITREQSFDLTALQIEGTNNIILNIEDLPEPLSYSY